MRLKKPRRQSKIIEKLLVCSKCGSKRYIPRKKSLNHAAGHIKHMWCVVCQEITAHEEIGYS
jgi:ribosomal protein L33